jgi:hypothetical protein
LRSALYYPHTTIRSQELLKTALLLWDKVKIIAPWHHFRTEYTEPTTQEAVELIGEYHYPSDDEKKQAHLLIEDLITRPLPKPFYFEPEEQGRADYAMYYQKLLPDTWRMLRDAQLAHLPQMDRLFAGSDRDFILTSLAGLSVMSLLADSCAGETHRRITDRVAAYATLAGLLQDPNGEIVDEPDTGFERLVQISVEVIDVKKLDLKTLIEFRKREAKEGGHSIRDLRHRYVEKLESFVKTLTTVRGHQADADEVKRQFRQDMGDDVTKLKEELRSNLWDVVLSKEMLIAGIAGAGTIAAFMFNAPVPMTEVATTTGGTFSIGGLLGMRNKFLATRRSLLERHPMAYLYELGRSPLSI